jgi:predicted lipid-binding transport protein (Tim44 family)
MTPMTGQTSPWAQPPAAPAQQAWWAQGAQGAQGASAGRNFRRETPRRRLEALRETDQNFSLVLFEDFVYSLYAEVHTARGRGQIARFSAYLAPPVAQALASAYYGEVRDVIVGAMHVKEARVGSPSESHDRVTVEIESNYTEQSAQGAFTYYVVEQWRLARKRCAQSRTPGRAKVFGCPSCGAPQDAVMAGTCSYCQKLVATGDFDWIVENVELVKREPRPPSITGDAPEVGTDQPTVYDPEVQARLAALQQKDPAWTADSFRARIALVFNEFQVAWSSRDLARMRPFLSDNLFSTQTYWIETYKRQRLRNVTTEGTRILDIQLVRATADAFYDAVTVRVYATGLDYTISDDGRMVGGSRSNPRTYSEYWTLIRGTNRRGPTKTTPDCPNCGAPLKINMVGSCEYCQAKVTSGDFDWVLSRIEQDESYEG